MNICKMNSTNPICNLSTKLKIPGMISSGFRCAREMLSLREGLDNRFLGSTRRPILRTKTTMLRNVEV
jgi:hypothetical protein